jgi:threonine aldolase
VLSWESIRRVIAPKIYYRAPTGLIAVENTHNMAGGTVIPLEVLEEIWEGARDAKLPVHLDGARVFNAATGLGVDVATLTRGFDTVMFCLSKGLGAPVGSMLVGSRELIERARVFRKALGGGMRQAGVLAAAGLIALEEMPKRLGEDHANARLLAEAIARCDAAEIDPAEVQTNIVIFTLKQGSAESEDAPALVRKLREHGVLASAIGPHAVRLVTHYDVSREDCERAASAVEQLLCRAAIQA